MKLKFSKRITISGAYCLLRGRCENLSAAAVDHERLAFRAGTGSEGERQFIRSCPCYLQAVQYVKNPEMMLAAQAQ